MKTIRVNASNSYDCIVGSDILKRCGELTSKRIPSGRACIITDETVSSLYLQDVKKSYEAAGFECAAFIFPGGEDNKNMTTIESILDYLADSRFSRGDFIVALGGGIVGDVAGFAAASYLRGIRFVQIPTTLLAAVDSSVGGKTGVNLSAGKNLAGAFHQPSLVICDVDTFETMSRDRYLDGMGEIIKYAVLDGEDVLDKYREDRISGVCRCIEIKRDIVERDERESGERKLLNLGHTFAHAIEKLSNFEITHGHAVAIGTEKIAKVGEKMGICEKGTADRIKELLIREGLPYETGFSAKEIANAAMNDKKRFGGEITLVIPERMGKCILKNVNTKELEELIK